MKDRIYSTAAITYSPTQRNEYRCAIQTWGHHTSGKRCEVHLHPRIIGSPVYRLVLLPHQQQHPDQEVVHESMRRRLDDQGARSRRTESGYMRRVVVCLSSARFQVSFKSVLASDE